METASAPERWTERQAIVVVFVAIACLLIGGIVGYGMATPNTAHAASTVDIEAMKAEALALAPEQAAVTKVTDLGRGLVEVRTAPVSAALQAAPPWIYPGHGDTGGCWGFWMGDSNLFLSGQHVVMVRAFFTGVYNYSTGQTLPANEQNKPCVATVQTRPFWGHSGGWQMATKIAYAGTGITSGPHYAGQYYARTWGLSGSTGCKELHGSVYISGHGFAAGKVRVHC